jgi:hypothetical protein
VKVVLPVIAHSQVQRKIRFQADVIFYKTTKDLLQKRDVALTGLYEISRGCSGGIVGSAGKRVRAAPVGEVIQAAEADIRNIDAEAELVLTAGIGCKSVPSSIPVRRESDCAPPAVKGRKLQSAHQHSHYEQGVEVPYQNLSWSASVARTGEWLTLISCSNARWLRSKRGAAHVLVLG